MGTEPTRLRGAWDAEAARWIEWARAPDHDHFFWRMGLPALLALLPEPGRRTLDLACGEGRLARFAFSTVHPWNSLKAGRTTSTSTPTRRPGRAAGWR